MGFYRRTVFTNTAYKNSLNKTLNGYEVFLAFLRFAGTILRGMSKKVDIDNLRSGYFITKIEVMRRKKNT
jgi:hypothetical protein